MPENIVALQLIEGNDIFWLKSPCLNSDPGANMQLGNSIRFYIIVKRGTNQEADTT